MNAAYYERFARVLTRVGANLQPGETAVIQAPPEAYRLVRAVAEECWRAGARYVHAEYTDDLLQHGRALFAAENALDDTPDWLSEARARYGADSICMIVIAMPHAHEPFPGDLARLLHVQSAERGAWAGYDEAVADGHVSIVKTVLPNKRWARKLYPELSEDSAYDKLWETFASVCRLDMPDPVAAWEAHKAEVKEKKALLDALDIHGLHIENTHTDLTLDLVRGGHWIGGCAVNQKNGLEFVPNIPTEEIFFVPDCRTVNGVVSSTLPLNYKGELIEGIRLTVKNGVVVGHAATHGEELLRSILETDEGSRRFGEVSLVTVRSPIYRTGTVFYDTLLDENAACHMALGNATPGIVPDGYSLSLEERAALGINRSGVHVDFMIGSEHCKVTAHLADGSERVLLQNGDWAF